MNILKDTFGRRFPYIRLSISDVCNFKCGYCLPDGYKINKSDNRKFIEKEEIGRLAKALSELGVSGTSTKTCPQRHEEHQQSEQVQEE